MAAIISVQPILKWASPHMVRPKFWIVNGFCKTNGIIEKLMGMHQYTCSIRFETKADFQIL